MEIKAGNCAVLNELTMLLSKDIHFKELLLLVVIEVIWLSTHNRSSRAVNPEISSDRNAPSETSIFFSFVSPAMFNWVKKLSVAINQSRLAKALRSSVPIIC